MEQNVGRFKNQHENIVSVAQMRMLCECVVELDVIRLEMTILSVLG